VHIDLSEFLEETLLAVRQQDCLFSALGIVSRNRRDSPSEGVLFLIGRRIDMLKCFRCFGLCLAWCADHERSMLPSRVLTVARSEKSYTSYCTFPDGFVTFIRFPCRAREGIVTLPLGGLWESTA
jgi:hypothetical protein